MSVLRPFLLSVALGGVLSVASSPAQAELVYSAAAPGVCQAKDGNNTDLFFGQFSVANKGTSTKIVLCNVGFIRERLITLAPESGYALTLGVFTNAPASQFVACTAAVGPSNPLVQSTKGVTVNPGENSTLTYTEAELRSVNDSVTLAIVCTLPPKAGIGSVIAEQPETNALIP